MFPLLVYIKLLLFGLLLEEIVVAVKRNIEDEASKRDGHIFLNHNLWLNKMNVGEPQLKKI